MEPSGTKVLVHIKPHKRASWRFNSVTGWYLGPEMDHYCSYKADIDPSSAKRIRNKINFIHHAVIIPELLPTNRIIKAGKHLQDTIEEQHIEGNVAQMKTVEKCRQVILNKRSKTSKMSKLTQAQH